MAFIVKIVPPHLDKGFSIQILGRLDEKVERDFRSLLRTPEFRAVNAFLQGDELGWKMIELWTRDEEYISRCRKVAEEVLGFEIVTGEFTQDEIYALDKFGGVG